MPFGVNRRPKISKSGSFERQQVSPQSASGPLSYTAFIQSPLIRYSIAARSGLNLGTIRELSRLPRGVAASTNARSNSGQK